MFHYIIISLLDLVLGGLALSKRNRCLPLAFAALCFSSWSIELFFLSYVKDVELLSILFHVFRWGLFFIPVSFLMITYHVVKLKSPKFVYGVIVPFALLSSYLAIANTFFFPSELIEGNNVYMPVLGPIYYTYCIELPLALVIAMLYITFQYKHCASRHKKDCQWMFFTLFVCVSLSTLMLILFHYNVYLKKFSAAFCNLIIMGLAYYSVSSKEKMDLPLALINTLTKVFVIGLFVLAFFMIASLVIGDIQYSNGTILILSLYLYFVLFSYPLLLEKLLPFTRKIFIHQYHDIKQDKFHLSKSLGECSEELELSRILNHFLKSKLKLKAFKLLLRDNSAFHIPHLPGEAPTGRIKEYLPSLEVNTLSHKNYLPMDELSKPTQKELKALSCHVLFPVHYGNETIAVLAIGHNKSSAYLNYEDLQLLEFLCNKLANTLHRINQFNHVQQELVEARKTLSLVGVMNQYHHDIKTPLAIIDGVMSEDLYDQEKQKSIVLEQVERGTRLIATMASILRGKRSKKLEEVNLEHLLRDSLFIFASRFSETHIEFLNDTSIIGDAIDLKIMFINIIKNAAEAGSRELNNKLNIKGWSDSHHIYIDITDSGIGIEKEKLQELQEEWQLDTTKSSGSGVGLQAVKRIADEHNARIDIKSIPGHGTTFGFSFPCSAGDDRAYRQQQSIVIQD